MAVQVDLALYCNCHCHQNSRSNHFYREHTNREKVICVVTGLLDIQEFKSDSFKSEFLNTNERVKCGEIDLKVEEYSF